MQNYWTINRSLAGLVLIHAAAWTVFIGYEMLMLYFFSGEIAHMGNSLVYYLLHILLFYLQSYGVLPFAFNRTSRPYVTTVLLVIAEMAVYLLVKYGIDYFMASFSLSLREPVRITRYILINTWRGLYFTAFATVYWMVRRLFAYYRAMAEADKRQLLLMAEKTEIEKNLAEVRYAYLQQQISPHFLFNTLNFMYNAVYKVSPPVSASILQLSDMMRYSLAEPDAAGKTDLENELEQIRNFIRISRVRYDFELYIDLDIPETAAGLKIIPLILLTLVENVFKHGNLKQQTCPARISLAVDKNDLLTFETWNLRKRPPTEKAAKSIGLQNTVKRLDHVYAANYRLDITGDAESFQLKLHLQL